jgi:multidrug efflux system membrane fusion protein
MGEGKIDMKNVEELKGATREAVAATREKVGQLEQRYGRKRVYIGGGIVAFFVILILFRLIAGGPKKQPPPPPRPVIVTKVITKDVPLYLDEIGTCTAIESVQIQAQVGGQITERLFKDGADVKKGDPLFTIDPRPYQAVLDQAKAQAALDDVNLKRQQELRARNVNSPQDIDTAEANARKSAAAAAAAQVNLDYCNIRSPIDGRAGLRAIDVGNVVTGGNAGGTNLLTIEKFDPIYTDFTIAENDMAQVRQYLGGPNVKVQTDSPDDNTPPLTGDLYFIDNAVQPGSGTVKARGLTPNPNRVLWPGEFVRVRLILDKLTGATLVPSQTVQISQQGPFVFVVKPDNTIEQRTVKPGQRQEGDMMVIEDGLKPDETVVVTGQLALAPGVKVAPQPINAPQPANGSPAAAAGSK